MNFNIPDGTSDFGAERQSGRYIKRPEAYAFIRGSSEYPQIRGLMLFYSENGGTWAEVEVRGLPDYRPATASSQPIGPFGFHIHDGKACGPANAKPPFPDSRGHFNPANQPHGNHAGDLPVLFSNNGYAKMSFFTDKFKPKDIYYKTVVIHLNPDDYRTQPAGNSGTKIACGVINKL